MPVDLPSRAKPAAAPVQKERRYPRSPAACARGRGAAESVDHRSYLARSARSQTLPVGAQLEHLEVGRDFSHEARR